MSVNIKLEWCEYLYAAFVGLMREAEGYRNANAKRLYNGADEIVTHVQGAMAEIAVAKVLNLYWGGGVNAFATPDVGRKTEVRYTEYNTGKLLIRHKDTDDRPFVLVRGRPPNLEVVGWMRGRDAKQDEFWVEEATAFMVPADKLTPITWQEKAHAEPRE